MTIPTPAGDIEVLIGDQFECGEAKLEVVCFSMEDPGLVSCRVVSGTLIAQVHGPKGGSVIDEEFKAGDLLTCNVDHIAPLVLKTNWAEKSPRIPKRPTPPTKARPNKKEKPATSQQSLL